MKKTVAWLMAGLLLFTVFLNIQSSPSLAVTTPLYDVKAEADAIALKSLKLFEGNETGFDLYRTGTRTEGAVMLVRLLGREDEAKNKTQAHPFKDVPVWANGYISLLYGAGLTNGISSTSFGAKDSLTGRQYGAFVLRTLGFGTDSADVYKNAVSILLDLRLITAESTIATFPDEPILRGDMVKLSTNALSISRKGGTRTLLDALVLQGQSPANAAGVWLARKMAPAILAKATAGTAGTAGAANTTDPYTQTLAFHDWLVNQNTYGFLPAKDDPKQLYSGEGYAALSLGTGVCGAYSEAMKMLCDTVQIPSKVVFGDAYSTSGWTGHAWNQVQLDGAWYHMDVTFDDPLGVTTLRHNYFNVTDAEIQKDHQWNRSAYPVCTATKANYFVMNGQTVASMDQFEKSILSVVQSKGREVTVRVQPYSSGIVNEGTIKRILSGSGLVAGYTYSLDTTMGIVKLMDIRYFDEPIG